MSFLKLCVLLSYFHNCITMKVAVLRFSRRDEIRKVKLYDIPENATVEVFSTVLCNKIPDVRAKSLEYYNDNLGIFQKRKNEDILAIDKFISVLVIEEPEESVGNPDLLLIEGRAFDISSGLHINGHTLNIIERANRSEGTGLNTWDGSIVLAKYLERNPQVVRHKNVLEVGAGTGVSGLSSYLLGATLTVLTDLEYVLENLEENAHAVLQSKDGVSRELHSDSEEDQCTGQLLVKPLDWSDSSTYLFPSVSSTGRYTEVVGEQIWDNSGVLSRSCGQWDVILGMYISKS